MRHFIQSIVMFAMRNIRFYHMVNELHPRIDPNGILKGMGFPDKANDIVQYDSDLAFKIMMVCLPEDFFDDKVIFKKLLELCYQDKKHIDAQAMSESGLAVNEIEISDFIIAKPLEAIRQVLVDVLPQPNVQD